MAVLSYLATQPLIALILILLLGLAAGKVRLFNISLGPAAVLFVALGLSALNPDIKLPPLLFQLGLAMFVYAIGLSAGAQFFAEFRTRGWRLNLFMAGLLLVVGVVCFLVVSGLGLDAVKGAGMFAGVLTSTPAMAAIVAMAEGIDPARAGDAVIGYSLVYPGAVLACILVAAVGANVLKVDHVEDAKKEGLIVAPLGWRALRLREDVVAAHPGLRVGDLAGLVAAPVVVTRIVAGPRDHELADPGRAVTVGMVVVINGTQEALDVAEAALGHQVEADLHGSGLEFRRLTVSNPDVEGRTIGELDTVAHGFSIARLRRGDMDIVPRPEEVLHYSDRVRVVAAPQRMREVNAFFGDSERKLADVDLLPFALGLLGGLLIGAIPIPLPGGNTLALGFGGGPIVAGLILGALGRSGAVHWKIPYHANRTISALGLALFLAGVGTTAGAGFRAALTDVSSLIFVGVGFVITVVAALVTALVTMKTMHLTWDEAMGVMAGGTTNPAIISYLNGQTGTELPTRGYATVYPTAMVGKILVGQVLLLLLL